ncbi:DHHA1 domain-containing protein [Streptomyces roseirectus]|uniref:DHHA1 domain-containing protein n=1 Tax=Streptomyces roseirectus TaxID=2768066 RepID=UPI001FECDD62|nr:DHHA1 domain-containing protein [Streptomyces roseirectus]
MLLGARPVDAPGALRKRLEAFAVVQAELERLRTGELRRRAGHLAGRARRAGRGQLIVQEVTGVTSDELRLLAAETLTSLGHTPAVVIFGAEHDGKALLAAALSTDLHLRGVEAGRLLTDAARMVGGGSGGHGPLASAGGRRPEELRRALDLAAREADRLLGED